MVVSMDEVIATFTASLRSVGTACTLAGVGMYLHRRGFIVGEGKRTLALISQQVTIPLLLFTKIVYCNQNWSTEPCPSVTSSLGEVWMILFWPLYVCSCGLIVGYIVARICQTPPKQIRSVLAACGFANSTGLPITLLTVIHQNFPTNCELGRIDPTIFLSVYLILYPVLQWGLGGWILCPEEEEEEPDEQKVIENNETKEEEEETNDNNNNNNGVTTTTSNPINASANTAAAIGGYVRACLKVTQDGEVSVVAAHEEMDHNTSNAGNGNNDEETGGAAGSSNTCAAAMEYNNNNTNNITSTQRRGNLLSRSFMGGDNNTSQRFQHNVLNNTAVSKWYKHLHNGLGDTDAALYISSANLQEMYPSQIDDAVQAALVRAGISINSDMDNLSVTDQSVDSSTTNGTGDRYLIIESDSEAALNEMIKSSTTKNKTKRIGSLGQIIEPTVAESSEQEGITSSSNEQTPLITSSSTNQKTTHYTIEDSSIKVDQVPVEEIDTAANRKHKKNHRDHHYKKTKKESIRDIEKRTKRNLLRQSKVTTSRSTSFKEDPKVTVFETLQKITQRCLQPPVVGAVFGIFVASISFLRGIFVDIVTRSSDAPLQWFFDGLYSVGLAAVPINMMILGCNLSASNLFSLDTFKRNNTTSTMSTGGNHIDAKTITGIVIGKMIILPIIGIISCIILKNYIWNIPEDIDAPFYLVLMIVFITPTANNVMVMVELSGSASKEGMARVIGLQYLCAPIMLSLSVTGVVHVASQWMHENDNNNDGNVAIVQGNTYGL